MTGPGGEMAAGMASRGAMRTSRAEREQAIEVLKIAFVEDRLAKDEFDVRAGQALTARTAAELAALTADIPVGPAAAGPLRTPARTKARPLIGSSAIRHEGPAASEQGRPDGHLHDPYRGGRARRTPADDAR